MSIVKFPGDTPPREVNDAIARDQRFRDLEHEVCNLERMGGIVHGLVAEWLNVAGNPLPREGELMVFAVEQIDKLLMEFKAHYYGAWGPEGQS
jgi:hypothetical protein